MGAAEQRSSMPAEEQPEEQPEEHRPGRRPGRGGRPAARCVTARRGAVAAVGGAVVVDLALWAALPDTFAQLPTAFWVMAALALAVDARPYVIANRRASSVILPSIC